MSAIIFNVADFRTQFPAFSNSSTFPDDTLQMYFDISTLYINNPSRPAYCGLNSPKRTQALYLMTAHLTAISVMIAANQGPGIMVNASVDKVAVGLEPPPVANQWQYWLQSTPYGQQLLALLSVASVGGLYIGGSTQRCAFRGAGG